jgi:broad specificity phosphatase PhoE
MTRFIVVRHGRSTANDRGVFSCRQDVPLSPVGIKQAQHVANHLAAHEQIDAIYTSGLLRTIQTAAPTAERFGLKTQTEPDLCEIFAGLWEGVHYNELKRRFHEDWMNWLYDFSNARCTGGESVRELYRRMETTIHRIAAQNKDRTVMLVTHCTPLRVMIAMSMGYSPDRVHLAPTPTNATVNIFDYEDGALTAEVTNLITYPDSLYFTHAHPLPPRIPK